MATIRALLFLTAVSSKVFAIEAPISNYGVESLSWNIHLDPRDNPITLNGTIEQVISEAKKLNPRWGQDLEKRNPLPDDDAPWRDNVWVSRVVCTNSGVWKPAKAVRILEGIDYLSKISAKLTLGPGPGKCSRVSCSYKSAIWWCNNRTKELILNNFDPIISAARAILKDCEKHGTVCGQADMPPEWQVIVRQDMDNC
ncbi:hypothetical protein E4U15_000979 [Claviceps sp. LM218 group G6]|nr:hypothetical protein E4U15_000979 [Claviceps sp. LM218 group G6]